MDTLPVNLSLEQRTIKALRQEVEKLRAENDKLRADLAALQASYDNYVALVNDYHDDGGK